MSRGGCQAAVNTTPVTPNLSAPFCPQQLNKTTSMLCCLGAAGWGDAYGSFVQPSAGMPEMKAGCVLETFDLPLP